MAEQSGRATVTAYAAAAREVFAAQPFRAPVTLAKALAARTLLGHGPHHFFLFDLHNRPISTWRDHLKLYPHFGKALKLINLRQATLEEERDKLVATARLSAAGVPMAPILMVLGRNSERHHVPPGIEAPAAIEVAAARLDAGDIPDAVFVKPCADFGGHGVTLAKRVPGGWDVGLERVTTLELTTRLWAAGRGAGMLVQPHLRNHAGMAGFGGSFGLCTVRIITALLRSGPRVVAAAAKLLRGPGLADNFSEGHSGNLLANVDIATGTLGTVYGRMPGRRFLMDRFGAHPATGSPLTGERLPDWAAAVEVAKATSRALPDSPLLGLDIAITDRGPLLLERNLHWDLALPQLAGGEGIRATMRRILPELDVADDIRDAASRLLFGRTNVAMTPADRSR